MTVNNRFLRSEFEDNFYTTGFMSTFYAKDYAVVLSIIYYFQIRRELDDYKYIIMCIAAATVIS